VSIACLTTLCHSARSVAFHLSVCRSSLHQSMISSVHSRHGFPFRALPSITPNTMTFLLQKLTTAARKCFTVSSSGSRCAALFQNNLDTSSDDNVRSVATPVKSVPVANVGGGVSSGSSAGVGAPAGGTGGAAVGSGGANDEVRRVQAECRHLSDEIQRLREDNGKLRVRYLLTHLSTCLLIFTANGSLYDLLYFSSCEPHSHGMSTVQSSSPTVSFWQYIERLVQQYQC